MRNNLGLTLLPIRVIIQGQLGSSPGQREIALVERLGLGLPAVRAGGQALVAATWHLVERAREAGDPPDQHQHGIDTNALLAAWIATRRAVCANQPLPALG